MGTVAKRLFFRLTTAAPDIAPWLDIHDNGLIIFAHHQLLTGPGLLVVLGVFGVLTALGGASGLLDKAWIGWPKLWIWPVNKH